MKIRREVLTLVFLKSVIEVLLRYAKRYGIMLSSPVSLFPFHVPTLGSLEDLGLNRNRPPGRTGCYAASRGFIPLLIYI